MAVTKSWGYTNTTDSLVDVVPKKLGVHTNYALISDEPTECVISNTTTPVDQEEILSYRCKRIQTVNTNCTIQHPALVKNGVQYTVSTEAVLRVTAEDGVITDHPVVVYTVVRHDLSGDIADSDIAAAIVRNLSAFKNDDGSWKIDKLRRSALKNTAD